MNTADRSIAIVDVAVRRRFGFVSMWPQTGVVRQHGCELMQEAFQRLLNLFVEYATPDALNLLPGHSYFLEADEGEAAQSLRSNLVPLLSEYLAEGLVAGFSDSIQAYLQWLNGVTNGA
jgi:5-methylcytosine-specific restriction enzyme B